MREALLGTDLFKRFCPHENYCLNSRNNTLWKRNGFHCPNAVTSDNTGKCPKIQTQICFCKCLWTSLKWLDLHQRIKIWIKLMRTEAENKPNLWVKTGWGKGREIYLWRGIRPGSKELRSQNDLAVLPYSREKPPQGCSRDSTPSSKLLFKIKHIQAISRMSAR